MSKAHFIAPRVPQAAAQTVRLGTAGAKFTTSDVGKLVKLSAESAYDAVAVGNPIEGIIAAVESAPSANFAIGSIFSEGAAFVVADGSEAAGTGNLAIGDYVVAGTPVAKGTSLSTDGGFPRVRKATEQPGAAVVLADNLVATINAGLVKVAAADRAGRFAWRVVSLGSAGTGAPGTVVVIERV